MNRAIHKAMAHTILAAAGWAERFANWIAAHSEGITELNVAMARFARDTAQMRAKCEEVLRDE